MRTFEEVNADIDQSMLINDIGALRILAQEISTLDTPRAEASSLNAVGWADSIIGDFTSALDNYLHSLKLYEELRDVSGVAKVSCNIGNVHADTGDFPSAIEFYRRALTIQEELGNRSSVAAITGNMGSVYYSTGDYPSALEQFRVALAESEELRNDKSVAAIMTNMGAVFYSTADYDAAIEHFRRALAIYEKIGLSTGVAGSIGNLGKVYHATGDYSTAMEHFHRALALHEELGDLAGVALETGSLILALIENAKYDEAAEVLERQASMRIDDPAVLAQRAANLARLAVAREDLDSAHEHLLQAVEITVESGIRAETANYHRSLRDLAQKRDDFAGYIEHNNEYLRISEEVRGRDATLKMAMMEAERNMEGERREREKERTLLYGALPESVANRMLRGEDVSGDHFDHASVMFLDVVGFTTYSHDLEPRVVAKLLDDVFNALDDLCDRHNVTKIKTIGDAYLAVAFPEEERSTEQKISFVALDIQQLNFTWPNQIPLQFRIGLHSGSVVAGVIGKKRLQYDVWGDTVNVASRMENSSEPGRIHVSSSFALALKGEMAKERSGETAVIPSTSEEQSASSQFPVPCSLIERGALEIKGKGIMQTYWLESAS